MEGKRYRMTILFILLFIIEDRDTVSSSSEIDLRFLLEGFVLASAELCLVISILSTSRCFMVLMQIYGKNDAVSQLNARI